MSSSITIPRRRKKHEIEHEQAASSPSLSSPSTPASAFASAFPSSYASSSGSGESSRNSDMAPPSTPAPVQQRRRLSLLSTSLAKAEYTVVNVGSPEAPRLITCVKASQGFNWNQDIFLPSYIDHDSENLERKREPVQDIILTDEEAAALLPQ